MINNNCLLCPSSILFKKEHSKIIGNIFSDKLIILPKYTFNKNKSYEDSLSILTDVYKEINNRNLNDDFTIIYSIKCPTTKEYGIYEESLLNCRNTVINDIKSLVNIKTIFLFGDSWKSINYEKPNFDSMNHIYRQFVFNSPCIKYFNIDKFNKLKNDFENALLLC